MLTLVCTALSASLAPLRVAGVDAVAVYAATRLSILLSIMVATCSITMMDATFPLRMICLPAVVQAFCLGVGLQLHPSGTWADPAAFPLHHTWHVLLAVQVLLAMLDVVYSQAEVQTAPASQSAIVKSQVAEALQLYFAARRSQSAIQKAEKLLKEHQTRIQASNAATLFPANHQHAGTQPWGWGFGRHFPSEALPSPRTGPRPVASSGLESDCWPARSSFHLLICFRCSSLIWMDVAVLGGSPSHRSCWKQR